MSYQMSNELELELLEKIAKLEKEILKLSGKTEKDEIPSFSFSNISENELNSIVEIEQKFIEHQFNSWFNSKIEISDEVENFLKILLLKVKNLIQSFHEEDLKLHFLSPLFLKIDFLSFENNCRDFYNEKLTYKTDKFILNGEVDFVLARGLKRSKTPYFFIQEFKKGKKQSDPEPQLLAELISGLELNNWQKIKGAYIVGAIWNFVILEKLGENRYQYFVSENFDSTKIEDLKHIYKNLLFIKNEIIKGVIK
jgi:hypothetical protein